MQKIFQGFAFTTSNFFKCWIVYAELLGLYFNCTEVDGNKNDVVFLRYHNFNEQNMKFDIFDSVPICCIYIFWNESCFWLGIDGIQAKKDAQKKKRKKKGKKGPDVGNMTNLKFALDLMMNDMDETKTKWVLLK